jgi:hypothetical protein
MDKDVHASYVCTNDEGETVAKGHVNADPDKQQVSSLLGSVPWYNENVRRLIMSSLLVEVGVSWKLELGWQGRKR